MKSKCLLIPFTLGLGLVLALLWVLGGQSAPAVAAPALSKVEGPARAPAAELHVCPSGCAYSSVQAAVDAASEGDVIKVAAGAYTGVSARAGVTQTVYVSKSITLRGGYTTTNWTTPDPVANPTTLDAQGQGRVLYIDGLISPTIEGLRITGGDPDGLSGVPWGDDAGGGVYIIGAMATLSQCQIYSNTAQVGGGVCLYYSDARLSGNTITSNDVEYFGGGLFLYYSNAMLSENTVISNAANFDGGGLFLDSSVATLDGNMIASNTASDDGGGLFLDSSAATLDGNMIASNTAEDGGRGGGVYLSYSPATLSENTVTSNTAVGGGGGLFLHHSDATLINNVVVAASDSEGLHIEASSPRLLHTTVVRNAGHDSLGVAVTNDWSDYSTVALTNTILVGHWLGIGVESGNTATLESTLWGSGEWANGADWWSEGTIITGTNNYWGDPAFVDPTSGDYHIGAGSAAIDVGVNAGVGDDIDGHPRPRGPAPDLGADELYVPDLTKSGPSRVLSGSPITYILTATNSRSVTITNLIITDAIPTGASYLSGGTRVGDVVSWTVPSLAYDASTQVAFVVTASTNITNSNYRVSADGIYSATGSLEVVTLVDTTPVAGLAVSNDSPMPLGQVTTLTATITVGSNVVYTWTFGDGETGGGAVVTHTYSAVGNYTAVVTASNSVSVVTATTTVTVEEAIAGLSAANDSPTALGEATTLTATVTAGSNVAYTWAFDDGEIGGGAVVTHTYPAVGSYTAVVTASNSVNVLTATATVTVTDVPIAGLAASDSSPTALGEITTLTATVTAGSNVAYTWAFGDGETGSGAVVTHTYPAVENYTAVVTASNSVNVFTATTTVTITGVPNLTINKSGPATATAGDLITYTLVITNSGNRDATGLLITDTLPSGASYVSGGSLNGNVVSWAVASLEASNSTMVQFAVTATQTITNSDYRVSADDGYSATGGMSVVTIVEAGCEPISELYLSRTPTSDLFTGNTVRFTANAYGTTPFTYTWALNGTQVGENRSTFEQTFDTAGTHTVAVTVANACGQGGDTMVVEVQDPSPGQPDLSQSYKSVNLASVESGDTLTYTLFLRNSNAVVATAILTDPIPAHTTYISGSTQASDGNPVTLAGEQLHWSGQIISGTPVVIEFAVKVLSAAVGTPITNVAFVDDGLGNIVLLEARSTYDPGYLLTIDEGALYTNIPTVTLRFSWNADDNIAYVKISNDGGFGPGGDTSDWIPVDPAGPAYEGWVLSTYGNLVLPCTVYAKFRDGTGRQYGPIQDDIIYDPTPPQVTRVEIITQGVQGIRATEGQNVILRVTVSDGNSGVDRLQISHSADFNQFSEVPATGSTTDVPWVLQPFGAVYVRVVDRAGNLSDVSGEQGLAQIYLPIVVRNRVTAGDAMYRGFIGDPPAPLNVTALTEGLSEQSVGLRHDSTSFAIHTRRKNKQ